MVILPPGEGSTITARAYATNQATGNCADEGPHVCDQLGMYENWRFRDGRLDPSPADVPDPSSTETPEPGVEIVRDAYGVPHVYAGGADEQTIERRIAYGIGYAQAEERLFQMEVLRRAAEGDLAQLLGSSYLQMDEVTRRDSETESEREAQISVLSPSNQAALQSYADGINAVIRNDTNNAPQMPAGFELLQDLPIRPWTASDTVAIISLEVANIAESAGNGLGYAAVAQRLQARYGLARAVSILDDLQFTHDPKAPVTVPSEQPARYTTAGRRYRTINYDRSDTAWLIAQQAPDVYAAEQAMLNGDQAVKQATTTLGLPVFGSNAWALAPSRTTTGGALLWGGPQVGYYAPEVFDELEVEGGQFHIHGVGVPGGGPGVVIGYTPHTAWSITTAQDDQVATYVDRVRSDGNGGYEYWWRGAWRPVQQRTESFQVRGESANLPITGQLPLPTYTTYTQTDYWTFHGPPSAPVPCAVVYLDAAASRAYCKVRTFWNQELQTGQAIVNVNKATNLAQFRAAVRGNVAGFNFVYGDQEGNIGYWHTGKVPLWPRGADPRMPLPGDGRYDWRGYLPPSAWPSVIDPAQGFIASWNNKPQASWDDAGDGTVWGAFQRSRQLMNMLSGHRRFTLTELWQMARRVGELDLRATLGFKRFITGLPQHFSLSGVERAAVSHVAGWDGTAFYPAGAQSLPSGGYDVRSPGFAVLDAWFASLENLVAAHVFGPVVGGADPAAAVQAFTRTPQTTSPQYEFFSDYDGFVYNVMSGYARGADYLGGESALQISRRALDQAIAQLTASQGHNPADWRAPMPMIDFQALDVAGVPSIPWENRGTWGQALELPPIR
jgi:penicillin G amidase